MASDSKNSFQRLQDEETQQNHPHPPPEIEHNVMGTARGVKFMGDVVELYFTRFLDLMVSIFGGSTSKSEMLLGGESDEDLNNSPEGKSKQN